MNSCIYRGRVRHRRFSPRAHEFSYSLFMMYLDLAELPSLFDGRRLWSTRRPALARFRREDHAGPAGIALEEWIRRFVQHHTGRRPAGPIRLLTHLRYFGYCFNPVSFYFVFDEHGEAVEDIVAEVNNTPWGEQHLYALTAQMNLAGRDKKRYRFAKTFHVSPFMPMDMLYDWRFTTPRGNLSIHMDNLRGAGKVFDATMTLRRAELSTATLAAALAQHPFMTGKVIGAIHWQALRIWLKGNPVFDHPVRMIYSEETSHE
jgi:DUF1365 family protein